MEITVLLTRYFGSFDGYAAFKEYRHLLATVQPVLKMPKPWLSHLQTPIQPKSNHPFFTGLTRHAIKR